MLEEKWTVFMSLTLNNSSNKNKEMFINYFPHVPQQEFILNISISGKAQIDSWSLICEIY